MQGLSVENKDWVSRRSLSTVNLLSLVSQRKCTAHFTTQCQGTWWKKKQVLKLWWCGRLWKPVCVCSCGTLPPWRMWSTPRKYGFRLKYLQWTLFTVSSLDSLTFCLELQRFPQCSLSLHFHPLTVSVRLASGKWNAFFFSLNNLANLWGASGDLYFFPPKQFPFIVHLPCVMVHFSGCPAEHWVVWSGSDSLWPVGRHPLRLPAWLTSPRLLFAVILNCRRALFPMSPRV